TFNLRRDREAVVADRLSRAAASLRQEVPDALAPTDQLDHAMHRVAGSESQPGLVEPSALDALHGKGNRATGADGVDAEIVTESGSAKHGVGIAHTAHWTESEQAFIFKAHTSVVAQPIDVLAPNRAGHTTGARSAVRLTNLLGRNACGRFERSGLKVTRRQN